MLKELIGQVKRLFSSKKNGSKLVYCLTDRLHYYKQFLLALSILFLIGYKQFREDFFCDSVGGVSSKVFNSACWTNGTTTINLKDTPTRIINGPSRKIVIPKNYHNDNNKLIRDLIPHIGIQFKFKDSHYEVINHNYMRSLWALLILMAFCSYLAQRSWSSIFELDILKALLKLPKSEELTIVKKAQEVNSFNLLIKLPNDERDKHLREFNCLEDLFVNSNLGSESYNLIIGFDNNEYNHLLDYYPNQLIYLLFAKRFNKLKKFSSSSSSKFKTNNNNNVNVNDKKLNFLSLKKTAYRDNIKNLNLKYKLFFHSLKSTLLTIMQFLLPLLTIGDKYKYYGWLYLKSWLNYYFNQFSNPSLQLSVNSIDYELSSRIWPTIVSCEYSQFGLHDMDHVTTQCSVPINEICSKLFVFIWWFIIINIFIEFYNLIFNLILLTLLSIKTKLTINLALKIFLLPRGTWKEVNEIASFRQKHEILLMKLLKEEKFAQSSPSSYSSASSSLTFIRDDNEDVNDNDYEQNLSIYNNNNNNKQLRNNRFIVEKSALDEKRELSNKNNNNNNSRNNNSWFLRTITPIDFKLFDKKRQNQTPPTTTTTTTTISFQQQNISTTDKAMLFGDSDQINKNTNEIDINLFYYFYLLYLRLNKSGKKTRQIIIMTNDALNNYIENLEKLRYQYNRRNNVSSRNSPSTIIRATKINDNNLKQAKEEIQQQQQQQQQQEIVKKVSTGSERAKTKGLPLASFDNVASQQQQFNINNEMRNDNLQLRQPNQEKILTRKADTTEIIIDVNQNNHNN